jgi:hypothetical protein
MVYLGFDMHRFEELVSTRKDEIGEDLLSLLTSFGDFVEFKEMMLNHKKEKHEESKSLQVIGRGIA